MKRRACRIVLAMVALCLSASLQAAETYGFDRITNNSSVNPEAQLFMDVSDAGSQQVLFHFRNMGPISSSVSRIYFDNGNPASVLASIAGITDSGSGVNFKSGATPPSLPGGVDVGFSTTPGLSAGSKAPVAPNGVNPPGEWVSLTLNLAAGKTFADTIAALGGGTLRVGLHVQAIGADGESDAFVNLPLGVTPPAPATIVPAPGAMLLAGIGTALVGWLRRRKSM